MSQATNFLKQYPRKVRYKNKVYQRQQHGYVNQDNSSDWIAIAVMMSYMDDDNAAEVTIVEVSEVQRQEELDAEQKCLDEDDWDEIETAADQADIWAEEARQSDSHSSEVNHSSSSVTSTPDPTPSPDYSSSPSPSFSDPGGF